MENICAGAAPVLNLDAIKPDASGKYSPLLYKWLKSKRFSHARHVVQTGSIIDRNVRSEHWRPREIIIGDLHDGYIGGRNLGDIICGSHGVKSQGFAYAVHLFGGVEITDQFWSEYQRIGRCAWDHSHTLHMIGDENRWHYIAGGRQRECQWCGRVFEVERRVIVEPPKTREIWSEYRASAPATLLHPMGSMGEAV